MMSKAIILFLFLLISLSCQRRLFYKDIIKNQTSYSLKIVNSFDINELLSLELKTDEFKMDSATIADHRNRRSNEIFGDTIELKPNKSHVKGHKEKYNRDVVYEQKLIGSIMRTAIYIGNKRVFLDTSKSKINFFDNRSGRCRFYITEKMLDLN